MLAVSQTGGIKVVSKITDKDKQEWVMGEYKQATIKKDGGECHHSNRPSTYRCFRPRWNSCDEQCSVKYIFKVLKYKRNNLHLKCILSNTTNAFQQTYLKYRFGIVCLVISVTRTLHWHNFVIVYGNLETSNHICCKI